MKAMSFLELKTLVIDLQSKLEGAQLQDVISNDRGLALGFRQQIHWWLIVDLNPANPFCLVFANHCPWKKAAKPKPLALFLNSHGKNLYFQKVFLEEQYGRVLKIELGNSEKHCTLEVQLIPKQANLLVQSEGKHIAWEKPRTLQPQAGPAQGPAPRALAEIHREWLAELQSGRRPSIDPQEQWEKKRQKDLEKKRKALNEIQQVLAESVSEKWYELGNYLKALAPEDFSKARVPREYASFLDFSRGLFENMQTAFEKAKQSAAKKAGTEERQQILQQEIQDLEQAHFDPAALEKSSRGKIDDLMQKTEARGRKLNLESGAIVYCGKSGGDNLALLRKAKAWDYWLHLKDYPGAHAIVHRQRDQEISFPELQKAARWVLKESMGSKELLDGQKYAVVLVECRFVRPIKGDKLGRVTYHNEKQFLISL